MDTVYYTLNTRKVKVSGGPDLLTFVPTPRAVPAGEVLDFERCRRRLETKAAWKELSRTVAHIPQLTEEEPQQADLPQPSPRMEKAANWLELAASAAVILVALAAAVVLFSI